MILKLKKNNGVTLIEMMIVVAILGVVSMMGSQLFINITRFYKQSSARSDIQRNARTAMDVIGRKLSEAAGHSVTIDRYDTSQPFYSRISFNDVEGKSFSCYQKGTKLYMTTTVGLVTTTSLLAESLRQLAFTYPMSDDTGLISVGLTFEKATYEGGTKSLQLSLEKVRIQNPNAS